MTRATGNNKNSGAGEDKSCLHFEIVIERIRT